MPVSTPFQSDLIGQRILLAFRGVDSVPPEMLRSLRQYKPAGVTLFRPFNFKEVDQVRSLTAELQVRAKELGLPLLLIAADQEGGQLMAIGGRMTLLPGNMALGATRSAGLAHKAGLVLGRELAAVGINVAYAPVCDVNINPQNPVIGIRSFGENPSLVGELAAAMLEGIQSCGVAAAAKHFPGHGDTSGDSHHGIPVLTQDLERMRRVEFSPFKDAIRSGVRLVMVGHVALPVLDSRQDVPATLSARVQKQLLRGELGYRGVTVTDAMDMLAINQGEAWEDEIIRAAVAGNDLLLITEDYEKHWRAYQALSRALQAGDLTGEEMQDSVQRVLDLKNWLGGQPQPGLEVVGCSEHTNIAAEIAERSVTLIRDLDGVLPLRLDPGQRTAVVMMRPADLTPADTSSYVNPGLAQALRAYHPDVDEYLVSQAPSAEDISQLCESLTAYRLVVIGTLNAYVQPGQAQLVSALAGKNIPLIAAALRLPYDLAAFPQVRTYLCTYSILQPSLDALAKAMFGKIPWQGQLPVSIPGMYDL
ncbi:MAG: glycoside hydrolase family 3 protein [Anaerolineales bacterium]|nr:glycoside hydrolase family 3 protein [Anaerolineales bacterium]